MKEIKGGTDRDGQRQHVVRKERNKKDFILETFNECNTIVVCTEKGEKA